MVNIVFCISEGNHTKRDEDEFSFDAVTQHFEYGSSAQRLDRLIKTLRITEDTLYQTKLRLSYKGETTLIDLKRICYIEITKRLVEVHVAEQEVTSFYAYGKISDLEQSLNKLGFIRVHRSFMVSVNHIVKITSSEITLSVGDRIHIGRTFRENVQSQLCSMKLVQSGR